MSANTEYSTLDREEIVQKRRERRKAVKQLKKLQKEQEVLNSRYARSEKVRIIPQNQLKDCQNLNDSRQINIHRKEKRRTAKVADLNLLEFLIERKQNKKERRIRMFPKKASHQIINKGKKREIPKKHVSCFKKKILAYRKQKKLATETAESDEVKNNAEIQFEIENVAAKLEEVSITVPKSPKKTIHSRSFQEYCDNLTSEELKSLTDKLLRDINRFQMRAFEKNEIKARAHKRFVIGFREVLHQVENKKAKIVIIAPDCEVCPVEGGLNDTISKIKSLCTEYNITYVFSLKRRQLGYSLFKKVSISCVAIMNYDGAQDVAQQLIDCLQKDRAAYINATKGDS